MQGPERSPYVHRMFGGELRVPSACDKPATKLGLVTDDSVTWVGNWFGCEARCTTRDHSLVLYALPVELGADVGVELVDQNGRQMAYAIKPRIRPNMSSHYGDYIQTLWMYEIRMRDISPFIWNGNVP